MRLLAILFALWMVVLPGWGQKPPPKLYVFMPSEIRPHAMKKALDKACPDLDIFVFPRFREFRDKITESPPEGILTFQSVADKAIEILKNQPETSSIEFSPLLASLQAGKRKERFVLLSDGAQQLNPNDLGTLTVGVLNLLGRSEMQDFIAQTINVNRSKIKMVTKLEDLLSLLQFEYVDAIFVAESKVSYYEGKSKLGLKSTTLPGVEIGLPVVVVQKDMDPAKIKIFRDSFKKLPEVINEKLGVDQWISY